MNKKFLTAFLFGATVLASTSTFVSCKDYSDEIGDLQTQIDNANKLHATKAELDYAKNALTEAYKAADAELQASIAELKKASESADTKLNDELTAKIAEEAKRAAAKEAALEKEINALQDADKNLQGLIDDLKSSKLDKTEFEAKVKEIYTDFAAADAKLAEQFAKDVKELKEADDQLKKDMEAADAVLQGNIDKVSETVGANNLVLEALKKDYEAQNAICKEYRTKVDNILKDYLTSKDKQELNDKITALETKLSDRIKKVEDRVKAIEDELPTIKDNIERLQAEVKAIKDELADINAELDRLNVLVKSSLRSLVFIPDSYYWGVEATQINYLQYTAYEVTKADVKTADDANVMGGTDVRAHVHGGKTTDGSKVLKFVAKYHLNPSSANLEGAKFALVTGDREYVRSFNEADALLSIVGTPTAANGILSVNLNAAKPELIKSVQANQAVTVFATQVTLPKEASAAKADTTITSDYATLYKSDIRNLVLSHVGDPNATTKNPYSPRYWNTHCGGLDQNKKPVAQCEYYKNNSGQTVFYGNHLFATENELVAAAGDFGQYDCDWDKTLDLTKLVETHYTNEDGTHMLMTAEKLEACGLKYKFELVGNLSGTNKTSESVHAAINPNDGVTFRPQEAQLVVNGNEKGYEQKAYGAPQSRETIGRTPVVRVSLVDAENGTVYDYGYIMIKITEQKQTAPADLSTTITYTGKDINYANTCQSADFTLEKYWNNIENDILKTLMDNYSMSKQEFDNNYKGNGTLVNNGNLVTQFKKDNTGAWVERQLNEYVGTVVDNYDPTDAQTSTLKWTVSGREIVTNYQGKTPGSYAGFETAVKYESLNPTRYPDIYIVLKSGAVVVTMPTGEAFSDYTKKISNFWYKVDGNGAADGANQSANMTNPDYYKEIHAQTIVPEDPQAQATADVLDDLFSDVFVNNKITLSSYTDNGNKDPYTLSLIFSDENNNKEYAALDGTKICYYTLEVRNNGYELWAVKKNNTNITPEMIASISTPTTNNVIDINKQVVALNKNSDIAKALLNYAAHNNLDKVSADGKKVLKAIIEMKATTACITIPLTAKTFDVRFLRPINVVGKNAQLEDAQAKTQKIELRDLVTLTDWRDYKFSDYPNYWEYYNIKHITVIGTTATDYTNWQNITAYVDTDMNGANFTKTQAEVDAQLMFEVKYANPTDKKKDSYGEILYQNKSTTVQTFTVRVPLLVEYEWGYVTTTADIKILDSHSNAKKK